MYVCRCVYMCRCDWIICVLPFYPLLTKSFPHLMYKQCNNIPVCLLLTSTTSEKLKCKYVPYMNARKQTIMSDGFLT